MNYLIVIFFGLFALSNAKLSKDELVDKCDSMSNKVNQLQDKANEEKDEKIKKELEEQVKNTESEMEEIGCGEFGAFDDVWAFIEIGMKKNEVEKLGKKEFCETFVEELEKKEDQFKKALKDDPQITKKATKALEQLIPVMKEIKKNNNCIE
ncbi:uncharacterized protein LOC141850062 [Brevipalpus obovatus]|uniref:uncharacterized protein LOC141850062 n=1 Tax=Brevipalpus obovatus TaxID=246614 RepID=UPI003D9F63C2